MTTDAPARSSVAPAPTPAVLRWVRRLGVPVRDPRFWVIQALVLGIDVGHSSLEDAGLLVGRSVLYLLSVSVFLIPLVYAALGFGLRGAVPTALWAMLLSLPETVHHDPVTRLGILIQFTILLGISVIVALRVDRERAAARASDEANRQLSRLNATAAEVAGSLDLDRVLHGTLLAGLDPRRDQVIWVTLTGGARSRDRTAVAASRGAVPPLDATQQRLTDAACRTGEAQVDDPSRAAAHTVVDALRSEDRVLGAIGLTQAGEPLTRDDFEVHHAIANQFGVALNNIGAHEQNRAALASLKVAKANLETYIELATDAQEEERKRLSRELHDDILQSLVVAQSRIESAGDATADEAARSRLGGAHDLLGDAIVNLRRYCHDLRPSLLDDLGLVDAVDWLVSDLRGRTGLAVELETAGIPRRLGSRDELLIFRIVQESLHNVEKHARASRARVSLSYTDDTLEVSVADDGRGLAGPAGGDPDAATHTPTHTVADTSPEAGLGLRGMDERTKLLRGTMTITSAPGRGTVLSFEVPLPPADPGSAGRRGGRVRPGRRGP